MAAILVFNIIIVPMKILRNELVDNRSTTQSILTEKIDMLWFMMVRFVRIVSASHGRTTSCVANRISN
jgi:hypothetical protein